jgi:hypothetical protein
MRYELWHLPGLQILQIMVQMGPSQTPSVRALVLFQYLEVEIRSKENILLASRLSVPG